MSNRVNCMDGTLQNAAIQANCAITNGKRVPHVAGVAVKSIDAGLTSAEREAKEAKVEEERLAEISISAFERGIKKRKKKKKRSGLASR